MLRNIFKSLFIVLCISSCLKEDLNLASDVELDAQWILPLLDLSVGVLDVLPNDEHIVVDSDSLVRVVYRDSIFKTIKGDSLLDFDGGTSVVQEFNVGVVELDDFESNVDVSLGEMTQEMDEELANSIIDAATYESAYFPPLNSIFGGQYSYEAFDNFSYIEINSGLLTLSLQNNLAISIETLIIGLMNDDTGQVVAEFSFSDIGVGSFASSQISIEGITLFNELSIVIIDFSSVGSGSDPFDESSWLSFNLSDELHFSILAQDMTIQSGNMVYPDVDLETDSTSIDLNMESDVTLSQVDFSGGVIQLEYHSSIHHPIDLYLQIPSLVVDGIPFEEQLVLEYTGSGLASFSWDLSGASLELNGIDNAIEFYYTGSILSNNQLVDFSSDDSLQMELSIEGMEFSYVQGYFGQELSSFDDELLSVDNAFVERFSEGVTLVDPSLTIFANSTVGIPLEVDFTFEGQSETASQFLNAFPFQIQAPSIGSGDAMVFSSVLYDVGNSSIEDLIAIRPNTFLFSGNVLINPQGYIEPNFVSSDSEINLGFEIDIPLDIHVDQFTMTDSVAVDVNEIDVLDAFTLKAYISNEFPLGAEVKVLFKDTVANINLDSLQINEVLAAEVGPDGEVTSPSNTELMIDFPASKLASLIAAHELIAEVHLDSQNSFSSPVKIYTDARFKMSLGLMLDVESGME